jgi:SAM-dependent methyltransferase
MGSGDLRGDPDESARIQRVYTKRAAAGTDGRFFGAEDLVHVYRVHERHWATLRLLRRAGLSSLAGLDVLDVGCGDGAMLSQFIEWGVAPERAAGIDIREEAVETSRRLCPSSAIKLGSAETLPWPNASFDLVSQITVFSSVLDADRRRRIAAEMIRVLRPSGVVLWYDFFYDNPANPNVVGIRRRELSALFPGFIASVRRLTLAPPISRRLPEWSLPLSYQMLQSVPFLRTHYLGLFHRAAR